MIKDSTPLMYIETVSDINESKNIVKKKYLNRVDDIKAMLYYKIDILCEIKTKDTLYEGIVKKLTDDELFLEIDSSMVNINLDAITDINILRL